MTVAELFAWLKANNAKVSFGFKKSVPYVALKFGGVRMQFVKNGELGEIEEALVGLIKGKMEESNAQPQ